MLKVSLHACKPGKETSMNVLGRMDIAYEVLQAEASYKSAMYVAGVGELPMSFITNYPRWSATVWDLVARLICLTLNQMEALCPEDVTPDKRPAFIENMSAVIAHWPDGLNKNVAQIATATITMHKRKGHYSAVFSSDLESDFGTSLFVHKPAGIQAWDLLARAYAHAASGRFVLPPRPALCLPIPIEENDKSYVAIDTLPAVTRNGLVRWMTRTQRPFSQVNIVSSECVSEEEFVDFLSTAV
jgi:hypothetical protein